METSFAKRNLSGQVYCTARRGAAPGATHEHPHRQFSHTKKRTANPTIKNNDKRGGAQEKRAKKLRLPIPVPSSPPHVPKIHTSHSIRHQCLCQEGASIMNAASWCRPRRGKSHQLTRSLSIKRRGVSTSIDEEPHANWRGIKTPIEEEPRANWRGPCANCEE